MSPNLFMKKRITLLFSSLINQKIESIYFSGPVMRILLRFDI